jgi:N-methylhydantoinase A
VRFAVDTGGTFTDLVVEDDAGALRLFKSRTTPDDPVRGVLDVLAEAERAMGAGLLARGSVFVHGTTRAINAVLTGTTARTAFLATEGHPDILLFREGGRTGAFDFTRPYPEPYVPRALTFEVPERIGAEGEVVKPLDEAAVVGLTARLRELAVEAVGVCLLWSVANPAHEARVGELLDEHLPGVPYTLSHRLNPAIREYRRASSTCIDASLKPVMSEYLRGLEGRLRAAGFAGRVLMVTSGGGVLDAADVAEAPIHSLGSGPAMAPVAGRYFAARDGASDTAVVADTGGTSYDVSLVRRGRIPWTRETWLGEPFFGHMTGFPSVDVKSIGAGGGSIASVDGGGLLHVGPESAGSEPGPACYGRGGSRPTVTDSALVLGYVDADYFLGGAMRLDAGAARAAVEEHVARPLGLPVEEAAAAVLRVATEHMVRAIEEITLHQGIDPRRAVLVGGGGAAGLNSVAIARRLGCSQLVVPAVGPALSAAGALMSDLTADFAGMLTTSTAAFDAGAVASLLADLRSRCERFAEAAGAPGEIELSAEARYPHQIWELELPVHEPLDADRIRSDFHALHEEVFAISDPGSEVELVGWRARVRCPVGRGEAGRLAWDGAPRPGASARTVYFAGAGTVDAAVVSFDELEPGRVLAGPAIVESPWTTIVVDPGATVERTASGSLAIQPVGVAGERRMEAIA